MNLPDLLYIFPVLIFNSLFIFGLHYSFSCDVFPGSNRIADKQSLWFVSYYSRKYLGDFWSKPVSECIVCMASLWGLPIYLLILAPDNIIHAVIGLLIYIPVLAGLNRFLIRFI